MATTLRPPRSSPTTPRPPDRWPVAVGPVHRVGGDEVLVDLPGAPQVLVRAGAIAHVSPGTDPEPDPDDVAWLLDGHVAQVAALQRGTLALRASAVTIDGRAVAICGWGAVGASAVAAGLARRGHPVLADGWLPVSIPGLRVPAVTAELALWPDVARLAGRDPDGGRPVRPGIDKRRHLFDAAEPAPLAAVVLLHRQDQEPDVSVERLAGGSSLERILRCVAVDHLVAPLDLTRERFLWAAAIAGGCAVHSLRLDRHRPGIDEPAAAVEALVRG